MTGLTYLNDLTDLNGLINSNDLTDFTNFTKFTDFIDSIDYIAKCNKNSKKQVPGTLHLLKVPTMRKQVYSINDAVAYIKYVAFSMTPKQYMNLEKSGQLHI